MSGGFLDWVKNKGWALPWQERELTLKPDASDRKIRKAIQQLLSIENAHEAKSALRGLLPRIQPLLEEAVTDPTIRQFTEWPHHCAQTPLEIVLELLDACQSPTPLQVAERLWDHPDWKVRRVAATYLTRTGRNRYAQQILRLLHDSEYLITTQAQEELLSAAAEDRIEKALAVQIYEAIKPWALRSDRGPSTGAGKLMLLIDRDRATVDLTSPEALDVRRNFLGYNLDAIRESNIKLTVETVCRLLEDALHGYDSEADDTNKYHWASAAESCIRFLHFLDAPDLDSTLRGLMAHPSESLRNEAADLQLKRLGFSPTEAVLKAIETLGWERANKAQKAYYAVWLLDCEVRNGGFLQYFSNSSGEHVVVAGDALMEMGAVSCLQVVQDAIGCFGPGGVPPDRNLRGDALIRLLEADDKPFDVLDGRWYDDEDHLQIRLQQFATTHRKQIEQT